MEQYRAAIKLDSSFSEALYGMAICLDKSAKWLEAYSFIKKAIDGDEVNGEYWFLLADIESKIGNVVSAIESYEKAANLSPNNPDIWVNWSLVYHEQSDFEKAFSIVTQGMIENVDEAELNYHACVYLINLGKYRDALEYLQNALVLDFEMHTILFDFFTSLEVQKGLYKIIEQYKNRQ